MITLIWDNYHSDSVAWLRSQRPIQIADSNVKDDIVEALLIRSQTKVDKKLLERFPKLKIVITSTSGFDHVDWKICQDKNITTAFCPNANSDSAAEHTVMLILNLLKNFPSQTSNIKSGEWRKGLTRGLLLKDKTLGLVGFGRIGQRVAKIANAFGANVIAHDPYQPEDIFKSLHTTRLGLTELFREVDILSLHVPYTKQTHHMINKSTIGELSDHTLLINASRGQVVEESDLITALREGHLAGAALDVFSKEPVEQNSFLLKEKKLIATPHTGAFTEEAWQQSSMEAAQKLVEFAKGSKISDTLPLDTPWFKDSLG